MAEQSRWFIFKNGIPGSPVWDKTSIYKRREVGLLGAQVLTLEHHEIFYYVATQHNFSSRRFHNQNPRQKSASERCTAIFLFWLKFLTMRQGVHMLVA